MNKKTLLSLRLTNNSCKNFIENPIFWLNKLNYKNNGSKNLHETWCTLIRKVKDENIDLEKNITLNLIKLVDNNDSIKTLFPLNVFSVFGDIPLGKVSNYFK